MQRKTLWLLFAMLTSFVLGLVLWLVPSPQTDSNSVSLAVAAESSPPQYIPPTSSVQQAMELPFVSKSQQDTAINCQLLLDQSQRLIVDEQTRNCFEYFITQHGEKNIDQIKQDFKRYIQQRYPAPVLQQILDLWHRYLDYRVQLGELKAPDLNKEDPDYYRKIFSSIKKLRSQFFSAYEIEGLFGTENAYHEYTLDRMSILANTALTEVEKAKQLEKLFTQLPEDWQENLKQLSKLEDLRQLTSALKARGGSAEELRQMRTNLVGPEATARLEQLDQNRSQWKTQVTRYLEQRDSILKSNMAPNAQQQAIQALRDQHFNQSQDQLRLGAFETTHDAGGKLPFAE